MMPPQQQQGHVTESNLHMYSQLKAHLDYRKMLQCNTLPAVQMDFPPSNPSNHNLLLQVCNYSLLSIEQDTHMLKSLKHVHVQTL